LTKGKTGGAVLNNQMKKGYFSLFDKNNKKETPGSRFTARRRSSLPQGFVAIVNQH
jgi:hypothetical protein